MATTNSPNSPPIVAIQSENIEEEIRKLETNAVPQEEYERMLSENTETQPQPLDKREINKLQAMFGNAKAQVAKYFVSFRNNYQPIAHKSLFFIFIDFWSIVFEYIVE